MLRCGMLKNKLPAGLKQASCERFDPNKWGQPPALRFVPAKPSEEEEGEEKQAAVKIAVSDGVTKTFREFDGGEPEEFIDLINRHRDLVRDLGLKEKYDALKDSKLEKEQELGSDRMDKRSAEAIKLKEEIAEIEASMKGYRDDAYRYMEKLMTEDLRKVWNEVVNKQCNEAPYTDLDGTEKTVKRGKTFKALWPCYKHLMAAICPPDSAERQIRYCDTTIKKNKEVSIAAHGYRLQQLNNMQIFLPTLKMQKGSPAGLVAMDKKVNELSMCSRLVASLPLSLSSAYIASKGSSFFPTNYNEVVADIELLEKSQDRTEGLLKQLTEKIQGKKKGREGNTKMDSGDRIPKKARKDDKKGGKPPSAKREQKLCNRCAQWAPAIKNTHNTADCLKFNADGTRKDGNDRGKYRGSKTVNVHGHDDDMMSAFNTMRKEQKQLRKQIKKMTAGSSHGRTKKHRSRRSYDTSDESSSDESN